MAFDDIHLVTSQLNLSGKDACARIERELGFTFPTGYAEFLSRFGEGTYSGFVRVYPPEKSRIEFGTAVQALSDLRVHDRIQIDEEDGFAEWFIGEFGGLVVVGFNGTDLTASIASEAGVDSPKLGAVRRCLDELGFVPEAP